VRYELCDQIGRIFAQWVTDYFVYYFVKMAVLAQAIRQLFSTVKVMY
jgi:hypothetical protein